MGVAMTRVSEEALETALHQLSEHVRRTADSNWTQAFLAGRRIAAAPYDSSTRGADRAVADLFTLVPNVRTGTLNPFINLNSTQRWLKNEQAGRSTVWNKATRGYTQTLLFNDDGAGGDRHIGNGIRADAIDVLLDQYQALGVTGPAGPALAVLLTRDVEWTAEPSTVELQTSAAEKLGLSLDEYERFTTPTPLGVPILGAPEWSSTLLERSSFGPPADVQPGTAAVQGHGYEEAPIEQITSLIDEFKKFATAYGITASDADIHDLLASTLGSQFVLMAGPSGSGKSLIASALAAFFAKKDRRTRLEGSRFLARQEEFLGYYSHLAGQQFIAQSPLLDLLPLGSTDERKDAPVVIIEEANLSPIEGYLSALVHGLGGTEAGTLDFRLHSRSDDVSTMDNGVTVPSRLTLAPYPRFFATINVDADSPSPARKVASRACVILTDTPSIEEARVSADILSQPSIEEADGPASTILGRPSSAFARYNESGSDVYEEALLRRGRQLSEVIGTEAVNFRSYQKALFYIAWYVELAGEDETQPDSVVVATAVDNAILHFVLPTLSAHQFAAAIEGLPDIAPTSVLASRVDRLKTALQGQTFGPSPDFWGALS
ncbi:ATP-binding protein [Microbacterium sp. 10M-3C3]|uniref:ATP-binding protein n=1 Tax=Microbacterium sp. 10M-3C3 TaxID=2483401 RepID=UPI000F6403D0|nr:ATP-binding protein [Microbacterium sp. 10M-3C3]